MQPAPGTVRPQRRSTYPRPQHSRAIQSTVCTLATVYKFLATEDTRTLLYITKSTIHVEINVGRRHPLGELETVGDVKRSKRSERITRTCETNVRRQIVSNLTGVAMDQLLELHYS